MKIKKIYVIPKLKSYVDSVQPHIYYPTEISKDVNDQLIEDLFRDNAFVYAVIGTKYYPLTYKNFKEEESFFQKDGNISFEKEQIDQIANGTFGNYVPEIIVDDSLEEDDEEEPPVKSATLTCELTATGTLNTTAVIKLNNEKFNSGITKIGKTAKSWFIDDSSSPVLGTLECDYSKVEEGNTKLTLNLSGTIDSILDKNVKVKIPGKLLVGNKPLETNTVQANLTPADSE